MDDRQGAGVAQLRGEAELRAAYDAHATELFRFAVRAFGDVGAAQDLVQETFVRAWRAADRFDPGVCSLRGWLFAIARNVIIDHHRRRRVRPVDPAGTITDLPESRRMTQPDLADEVVERWVLEEALQRLGHDHREAIVQTYLKARSYREVAAELGVSESTLRSRVFHGLKRLRAVLVEMEVTP